MQGAPVATGLASPTLIDFLSPCFDKHLMGSQPNDYKSLFSLWLGNEAYYLGPNGLPMISTYSSGGFTIDTWNCKSLIPPVESRHEY